MKPFAEEVRKQKIRDIVDQLGLDYISTSENNKDPMDAEKEQMKILDKAIEDILKEIK